MTFHCVFAGVLALGLCAAAGGCSSKPSYYLEPNLSDDNVATFDVRRGHDAPVSIDEVDGARIDRRWGGGPYRVKVMPGGRELTVSNNVPGGWSKRFWMSAVAGHTYRVESAGRNVRITDVQTGSISRLP